MNYMGFVKVESFKELFGELPEGTDSLIYGLVFNRGEIVKLACCKTEFEIRFILAGNKMQFSECLLLCENDKCNHKNNSGEICEVSFYNKKS